MAVYRPTFRQCQAATRSVQAAEHGRTTVALLRGERIGLGRPSPGLAVLLYLATLQGRLVWRGVDAFVVLRAPYGMPGGRRAGWHSLLARVVEKAWPYGRDFSLAVVLLPIALLGALAGAELFALVCVFVAVANVVVTLGWPLVRDARDTIGRLRGSRHHRSTPRALNRNWWIGLCHITSADPNDADLLLREALRQAMGLADDTAYANDVLVCPDGRVTTDAGRRAVAGAYTVIVVDEVSEPVLFVKVPGRAARADTASATVSPAQILNFLVLYFTAVALALVVVSLLVRAAEHSAGRPTSATCCCGCSTSSGCWVTWRP